MHLTLWTLSNGVGIVVSYTSTFIPVQCQGETKATLSTYPSNVVKTLQIFPRCCRFFFFRTIICGWYGPEKENPSGRTNQFSITTHVRLYKYFIFVCFSGLWRDNFHQVFWSSIQCSLNNICLKHNKNKRHKTGTLVCSILLFSNRPKRTFILNPPDRTFPSIHSSLSLLNIVYASFRKIQSHRYL